MNVEILEIIDDIIMESIPPKKYSHEWNEKLLQDKMLEIFDLNLPIKDWVNEEGVDDEEIKKRLFDQINQKYNEKKNNYSTELLKFAISYNYFTHTFFIDFFINYYNLFITFFS